MVHRHHIMAEKEEWKTAVEIDTLVKMINVMTEKKLNRTDSYLLQLIIHILNLLTRLSLFLCFSLYCFTLLWKHFKPVFTVYSQDPIQEGFNSAWSWNFFQNLINGWVLINKRSENSSLNKQVFCLHTLKSFLWKSQAIQHSRVYFSSSIILTYTGNTIVMSFNN